MFQGLSIKNSITFLLVLFVSSMTVITADNCSGIFKFNFNDSNSVESGSIKFLLEKEKNYGDLVLEIIFGFERSTILEENIPTIKFHGREIIDGHGENITLDVFFNLERRIPSIVKISISSDLNNFYKVLCENFEHSKLIIQVRASSFLGEVQQEIVTKTSELPVYMCENVDVEQSRLPSFTLHLQLNKTNPHFVPLCEASSDSFQEVALLGKVHTLTSDICDKFSNITHFYSILLSIKHVNSNAFNGCHDLTELYLFGNKLTSLPNDLFVNNKLLEILHLGHNKLRNIDGNIFTHTLALKRLVLSGNQLEKFPIDNMPVLPILEVLYLDHNNLSNLNVAAVMEKCPKLIYLFLHNKDFNEEKVNNMKTSFNDYNNTELLLTRF